MTDRTSAPRPAESRSATIDALILDTLRAAHQPLTQREIAQRLNMTGEHSGLWRPLRRLLDDGLIAHVEHCRYSPVLGSRKSQLGRTTIYSDDSVAARRFLHTMHAEIDRLQRLRRARRLAREWART